MEETKSIGKTNLDESIQLPKLWYKAWQKGVSSIWGIVPQVPKTKSFLKHVQIKEKST